MWQKEHAGKLDFSTTETFESIKLDNSGNVIVIARDYPANGGGVMLIKYSTRGEYRWTKRYNGSLTQMDEPTTHAIDMNDNIYVAACLRNSNYYIDMATEKFTPNVFSGLNENSIKNSLDLYPNPFRGLFEFKSINDKTTINVYSPTGVMSIHN
ncbi:MAG: hypothetical protein Q7U47_00960 [Paludibacter sp.]|nr:hypothetical protein [Paludibacter sp.]